ncbi:MAG: hypothetical protein H7175_03130 [Burkholderiales bacterium]|nr:hypothetical protein [Anaerolineae bacterium]
MPETKRISHQFLEVVKISEHPLDKVLVPILLALGIVFSAFQALAGDWLSVALTVFSLVLLLALAALSPLHTAILGHPFNRRHAMYVALFWAYSVVWLGLLRLLVVTPSQGKQSEFYYVLLIVVVALTVMASRSLLMLWRLGYRVFSTQIPMWEQLLLVVNELIATGLLAYIGGGLWVRLTQGNVFTTRVDLLYTIGLTLVALLYYLGMQLMWVQAWNNWLSTNRVWIRMSRLLAPLALLVVSLVITTHFARRADPRTANLLGEASFDLAILALAPVIWLVILVVTFLVWSRHGGLRQRFLPDLLLARLPGRIARFLSSISDMDLLLILGALSTLMPTYFFLLGDSGGVIGTLRQQILQRGSNVIETSEQALAVLFTIPFYILIMALLVIYAYVLSRASLSADEREELMRTLPLGFLIVLIITLYLFAIPFSQVLTAGRLPQLPQDLGRILAFDVLIPLVLLYLHYFALVRYPYGRGQGRWRIQQHNRLAYQLQDTDQRIQNLNGELEVLDRAWRDDSFSGGNMARFDTLYHYVQLNGLRDNLNMQRLHIITARQQLAEVSETPVSLTVARLPARVLTIGIPLLLAIQLYQWAVLNEGLRQVANNPNITPLEFIQILLDNIQF